MGTAYKVFRVDEGRLTSLFTYADECMIYPPDGSKICPKFGEIFVFKDRQDATAFSGLNEQVWEVETGTLRHRVFGNNRGFMSHKDWWALPRSLRHYSQVPLVPNTYTTPWVRLIRRV